MNKGKSVCERRVIRKELLEGWVVEQIETILKQYFQTPAGLAEIRRMVETELIGETPEIGNELDLVEMRIAEIKKVISNLIDNLTAANRDYVDVRIVELKRELVVLESRRLELEAAGAKQMELDRLVDQAIQLAADFEEVYDEGTMEESGYINLAFSTVQNMRKPEPLDSGLLYHL